MSAHANPIAPPLAPDATGCCHMPARIMGAWGCTRCYRPMHVVETADGERLKAEESKQAPSDAEAQAVFDELDSWLGRRGAES